MLRVKHDLIDSLLHVADGVGNDLEVGLFADSEIVPYVKIPGLSNQSHHRSFRVQQQLEALVLGRFCGRLSGGPKGHDLGLPLFEFLSFLKEIRVPGIGSRISAFDIVHTDLRKPVRHAELVLKGEGDILRLASVPQGGVVNQDILHKITCYRSMHRGVPARPSGQISPGSPPRW